MMSVATDLAAQTEGNVETMLAAVDKFATGLQKKFPWLFGAPGATTESTGGPQVSNPRIDYMRGRGAGRREETDYVAPRGIGPQDRSIWGSRLGIPTPRASSGALVDSPANVGYMTSATVASTIINNNQKIEVKPEFNITTPSLDEEQVRDLTNHVVKSINTALSLVGLRPVAS
jgi:hypothetical protein